MAKPLDDDEQQRIIDLLNAGKKHTEIVAATGRSDQGSLRRFCAGMERAFTSHYSSW